MSLNLLTTGLLIDNKCCILKRIFPTFRIGLHKVHACRLIRNLKHHTKKPPTNVNTKPCEAKTFRKKSREGGDKGTCNLTKHANRLNKGTSKSVPGSGLC